jgi:hypothetical protein
MSAISAIGMQNAMVWMATSADAITNMGTSSVEANIEQAASTSQPMTDSAFSHTAETTFSGDLVSATVNLKMAQIGFEANAEAFMATNDTLGTLIDMLDTKE